MSEKMSFDCREEISSPTRPARPTSGAAQPALGIGSPRLSSLETTARASRGEQDTDAAGTKRFLSDHLTRQADYQVELDCYAAVLKEVITALSNPLAGEEEVP